jgi:hypothetical protein
MEMHIIYKHGLDKSTINVIIKKDFKTHDKTVEIEALDMTSIPNAYHVTAMIHNGQRKYAIASIKSDDPYHDWVDLDITDDRWFPKLPQSLIDYITEKTT